MRHGVAWAALVVVLVPTFATVAQSERFLSAAEAARQLADSKPWNGTRPDGDHVILTFNPDGTGLFRGPITRTIAWSIRGDAFCIRIGFPLGSKCLRFRRTATGLQGFQGDTADLALSH